MRFPRVTVKAVTIGSALSLVISGVAFAATFSGGSSGTLAMNAGDTAHVTCAGPSLSVSNRAGTSLDLSCAPIPTPPPPGSGLTLAPSPPLALADGTNVPGRPPATATTVSFTPPANSLLVALGANNNYAYDYATSWQSVTGGGLSWSLVTRDNNGTGGAQGGVEAWAATVGASPGAMTVTARGNATQLSTADWIALKVLVFTSATGTPSVGASAVSASSPDDQRTGPPSATISGVQAGSLAVAVASDWSANPGAPVFGPGQMAIANGLSPSLNSNSPDFAFHFWQTSNPLTSAGSQTMNMTAPSQDFNEAAVEVRPGFSGGGGGPTTTQPPQTTTTAPATTTTQPVTTTTTVPSGGFSCSVSGTNSYCPGPGADYNYPAVSFNTGSNIYFNTNVFNPPPGFTGTACHTGTASPCQTLNANNPGDWSVTANLPNENGAVQSGVQVRTDVGFRPLSGFTSIRASSSDNLNAVAGTGAEFGYDFWSSTSSSSSFTQEMMVWTDTVNRGVCGGATVVATGIPIGGTNGVPLLNWNLCVNGANNANSEWIWYLPGTQDPTNTVDVYAMFQYMISHGHYSSATGLNQLDETFELCATGGFETFTASNLAITAG